MDTVIVGLLMLFLTGCFAPIPSDPDADASSGCVPSCRTGYTCVSGACVSDCNPPCAESETCSAAGECTPAAQDGGQSGPDALGGDGPVRDAPLAPHDAADARPRETGAGTCAVTVTPPGGPPGTDFAVSGTEWPASSVMVTITGPTGALAVPSADVPTSGGAFTYRFNSAGFSGNYTVHVADTGFRCSVDVLLAVR